MTAGFARCDEALIVPRYDSPEYLARILEIVELHKVDAILGFADPDIASLSRGREALSQAGVKCFFPDKVATDVTFDKLRTYEMARSLGVPVPTTALSRSDPALGGSLVMKPRRGSASVGVSFLEGHDATPETSDEPIFQDRLEGVEVNTEVLCDLDGRVVRTSAWRKLRSRHGETELAVTVVHEPALEAAVLVAEALPLVGPADFDWIIVDGTPHLIEINARFGGGYPVSHLAGAGFVQALVDMAMGHELSAESTYEAGVFMMKELRPFGGRIEDAGALLHVAQGTVEDEVGWL
jgi:carbamoyl-phosphate synthase large subunit